MKAKRSRDDAGDLAEDVDGKHMHTFLHCGVIKSARVVWAKELAYLDVNVYECDDFWAKVFKTNKDSADRATIAEHPGVPSAKFSIDVSVDDHTVVDSAVTTEELDSLRVFAQEWVADQIASNVVMDVDDSEDGDGAHGGGGADGGDGGGGGGGDGGNGGGGGDGGDGGGGNASGGNGGGGRDGRRGDAGGGNGAGGGDGGGGDASGGNGGSGGGGRVGAAGPHVASGGPSGSGGAWDAVVVPRRPGAGTGRIPTPMARHPFSFGAEEDDIEIRRPKKELWTRRRSQGSRPAGGGSMESNSPFSLGDADSASS